MTESLIEFLMKYTSVSTASIPAHKFDLVNAIGSLSRLKSKDN